MADLTFKGNPVHTNAALPTVGSQAPAFTLVKQDLSEASLASFEGKKKVLNVFPSIDTGICAKSVKTFHEKAGARTDAVVLNISKDLPFAAKRFCGAEGVENAVTLSAFRSKFASDYGLEMTDGPMKGLCARAVVVLDANDKVTYVELVDDIVHEPNYDAALAAL
ncbi:MAG: thiol peroxidase [Sandaracinaceae bacterium]